MNKLKNLLSGKKTYLVSAVIFLVGGLQALGIEIPTELYAILGSLLGVTLRSGIAKAE
jgi:hypothetical protein